MSLSVIDYETPEGIKKAWLGHFCSWYLSF